VFKTFKPEVEVEFQNSEGAPVKENLKFHSVADFSPKNITQNSNMLGELSLQQEQYAKMQKQLSSNKVLQKALKDEATRLAILDAIEQALSDLQNAQQES
jgi:predicted component of type VI protein secretion system